MKLELKNGVSVSGDFRECQVVNCITNYYLLLYTNAEFSFCSGKMSSALVPLSLSPAVEEGVEVNIEANLLSLNSSTLDKRDPDDVTEEC